jgi:hypothetical protein
MDPTEVLRESDPSVVARYLQLRSYFHDHLLARVEALLLRNYVAHPTTRLHATLVSLLRLGFIRPGEGELWPVVFLTPVDVTLAVCLHISPERLTSLGTMLNGPQRMRHRNWEDWWGWEAPLPEVHPHLFDLPADQQEAALLSWYAGKFDWLAQSGLLRPKPSPSV